MKKMPVTSADWTAEVTRLEAEVARAEGAISAEAAKRAALAVASDNGDKTAERQFNVSFENESTLRREMERAIAVLDHARQQVSIARSREEAELEHERQAARAAEYSNMQQSAARIDAILEQLAAEAARFDDHSARYRGHGGRFSRRTTQVLTAAAKKLGLRELLAVASSMPAISATDMVKSFDSASAERTEVA